MNAMPLLAPAATAAGELAAPFHALERLLDDLVGVLIDMPDTVYTARPVDQVSGSIGAHVRHILDHIAALLSHQRSTVLSYDHRERGTSAETDPSAAVRSILRLKAAIAQQASSDIGAPLLVRSKVLASGESVTGWSTFGRELAFVISHTIHHHAIVALLLACQGLEAPERFGYAPSTPKAS